MKIGMRKPSIKRSIKARTTGRMKREVKKAIIPWYGKNGIGILRPKKAMYNKIYRKTSFSFWDLLGLIAQSFDNNTTEISSRDEKIKEEISEKMSNLNDTLNALKKEYQEDLSTTPVKLELHNNSPNPKFHRSEREKKLKHDFFCKYYQQNSKLDSLEDRLLELRSIAMKEKNRDKKIIKLNEALECYDKIRKFCDSEGEGGKLYFEDMWEHCHNSSDPDFSYGHTMIELRNELINERELYIPQILNIISNNASILQKDLYVLVPSINKYTVQKLLRELEHEAKITRTKKNGSYTLKINQEKK
jgi:hypothetical protein|nr:MAG TPA: dissimilatory sulfite reductase D [Caudoviricetes sp.]